MVQIDVAVMATCFTVLGFMASFIIAGYKIYKEFEDLPERVRAIENDYASCPARNLDMDKLNAQLERLSDNIENDYYNIDALNDCQIAMMEGMLNMFQHLINGNHVNEMRASHEAMVKALLGAKKVRSEDGKMD